MCKLQIDSIEKSFEGKKLLQDVVLSCQKGEIVGLLGRNGSGKSTLLKIIFGSVKGDFSYVSIDNKVLNVILNRRKHINYLFQDHFLPSHIKVRKLIEVFCDKKYITQVCKHEFITPLLEYKSINLSGGERRLLEVLLMLHGKTEFILLDEPFNGIAPLYKDEVMRIMKSLSNEKGIIVTDHDYHNILRVSTHVVLLHEGHYKNINSKEELTFWGYLP